MVNGRKYKPAAKKVALQNEPMPKNLNLSLNPIQWGQCFFETPLRDRPLEFRPMSCIAEEWVSTLNFGPDG